MNEVKKLAVVVDDERTIVLLVASLLRMERFEVETASDGEEAWKKIQEFHPCLVISDFNMPGKNGLWLFRKTRDEFPEISFVLMTGKAEWEIADLGIKNVIHKPFDIKAFQTKIKEVLA